MKQSHPRQGDRVPRRTHSESPRDEGSVEELPPRFDANGRRIPQPGEDPLADGIENLLRNFMPSSGGAEGRRGGESRRR
jgi:hypothetical protein